MIFAATPVYDTRRNLCSCPRQMKNFRRTLITFDLPVPPAPPRYIRNCSLLRSRLCSDIRRNARACSVLRVFSLIILFISTSFVTDSAVNSWLNVGSCGESALRTSLRCEPSEILLILWSTALVDGRLLGTNLCFQTSRRISYSCRHVSSISLWVLKISSTSLLMESCDRLMDSFCCVSYMPLNSAARRQSVTFLTLDAVF